MTAGVLLRHVHRGDGLDGLCDQRFGAAMDVQNMVKEYLNLVAA
jgi:hypothetical protein